MHTIYKLDQAPEREREREREREVKNCKEYVRVL